MLLMQEPPPSVDQVGTFVSFFVLAILIVLGLLFRAWDMIERWLDSRITSSYDDQDEPELEAKPTVAQPSKNGVVSFAKPQNAIKDPLRFAEDAKLEALAQLILESRRKAFQNGIVPETRAIKAILGVSPSGDADSDYKRVKKSLEVKLRMLQDLDDTEYTPLTPAQAATRRELALEK